MFGHRIMYSNLKSSQRCLWCWLWPFLKLCKLCLRLLILFCFGLLLLVFWHLSNPMVLGADPNYQNFITLIQQQQQIGVLTLFYKMEEIVGNKPCVGGRGGDLPRCLISLVQRHGCWTILVPNKPTASFLTTLYSMALHMMFWFT